MIGRSYILGALFLSSLSHAYEVSENTSHSPWSALQSEIKEISTNIEQNGVVRLTGHLAENLNRQVEESIRLSQEESIVADIQAANEIAGNRTPAIVSADGIMSGELEPVDYPSYGIPNENFGEGSSFKPEIGVGGIGNVSTMAETMNKFNSENAGKLPIPFNVAPSAVPSKTSQYKSNEGGTPYEERSLGTTFGSSPADVSMAQLLKSKKSRADILAALQEQAEKDLERLQSEEDKKLEREKKQKEFKASVDEMLEWEPDYSQEQYDKVKALFNGDQELLRNTLENDPKFGEQAFKIYTNQPEGSPKTLGDLDADTKAKKNYSDFVTNFDSEKTAFPAEGQKIQKPIRTERAH